MQNCLSYCVPGVHNHTIHVRVLQKYEHLLEDGSYSSMLILVDALGNKIGASLGVEIRNDVAQIIQKGQWLSLTNFKVVQISPTHLNTSFNRCQIELIDSTIVKVIEPVNHSWYYDFVDFGHLKDGTIEVFKVVDLICKVVGVEDLVFTRDRTEENKFSDWAFLLFKTEDENGVQLECIALGDYAIKFNTAYNQRRINETTVCVLRWWSINSLNEDRCVQTLGNISEIELNPDIPEVHDFLSRLVINLTDDGNSSEDGG